MSNHDEAERRIREALDSGSKILDLSGMKLTEVPASIGQLAQLQQLSLDRNQLTEVPASIGQLAQLLVLDLGGNQLTEVPASIGQLSQLQVLDLSGNQLKQVPASIGQLSQLQELYLGGNQLKQVPASIGDLAQLQVLYLGGNQLTEVPASIGQLSQLQMLDLSGNQLKQVPASIGSLGLLKVLSFERNQLTEVPASIDQLSQLQELHLNGNSLAIIPETLIGLFEKPALQEVYLHTNPKLGLPPEILGSTREEIYSYENQSLPALQQKRPQNPRRIGRYLRQIQGGKAPRLNEAKLLVVGPGGAGKSSLIEKLRFGTFTSGKSSTHGIVVDSWEIDRDTGQPICVHVWDFGGQEIQHSTHEFFLSERAAYLLVFNPREDQSTQSVLYYWLDLIRMVAPQSPIIVALSRQDEFEGHVNDANSLKQEYKIVDFVCVSCIEKHRAHDNIANLKDLIARELRGLEHISNRLPPAWMKVKKTLEKRNADFLRYSSFQQICAKKGVTDAEDQQLLVRFLHDLGVMLNYADRIPLEETHILNPRWVTEGVYALVLCDELKTSQGILEEPLVTRLEGLVERMLRTENRLKETESIQGRYPFESRRFILEMMRRFELCHELPRSGARPGLRYLVPNGLPTDEPKRPFELTGALRFRLRYPRLLPISVISRFMVQMQADPDESVLWRQGIRGKLDGHDYEVTLHDRERKIDVAILGPEGEGRIAVLEKIRHALTLANRGKKGLTPVAWVPLPEDPQAEVEYDMLVKLADEGEKFHMTKGAGGKLVRVDVEKALRDIGEGNLVRSVIRGMDENAFMAMCRRHFPSVVQQFKQTMSYREKAKIVADQYEKGFRDKIEEWLVSGARFPTQLEKEKPMPLQTIGGTEESFPEKSLRILHLSDLHFTGDVAPLTKVQWLEDDLQRSLGKERLDFVIVSGDFTDKGRQEGFPLAAAFIQELCKRFTVPKQRCLVVPGNHDVQERTDAVYEYKRQLPAGIAEGRWVAEGRGFLVRKDAEYHQRFEAFSREFYQPLFGLDYPLDYREQGMARLFKEERLQFLLFNSAWEIDEYYRRRSGIHTGSLAYAIQQANEECRNHNLPANQILRIGVWHHAVTGQDLMRDTDFVGHLQKNGVKLALHGDVHELRRERIGYWHAPSSLHVIGAGSFASPQEGRKESIPRLYNLLELHPNRQSLRVHTRAQEQPEGAWEGWNRWPSRERPDSAARYPHFDLALTF